MRKIRNILGAALFVVIIGGTQACADSVTGPAGDDVGSECAWINGTLHCSSS